MDIEIAREKKAQDLPQSDSFQKDIEWFRRELGFTQKQMALLLKVDPSAWTRWRKKGDAPDWVRQSLTWYLLLTEKSPTVAAQFAQISSPEIAQLKDRISELERQLYESQVVLRHELRELKRVPVLGKSWKALFGGVIFVQFILLVYLVGVVAR